MKGVSVVLLAVAVLLLWLTVATQRQITDLQRRLEHQGQFLSQQEQQIETLRTRIDNYLLPCGNAE